ncbi:hypothetical protein EIN_329870, partial [Entamoeba invadens IP1]
MKNLLTKNIYIFGIINTIRIYLKPNSQSNNTKMVRFEMVYLMQISLYLPTMSDVLNFMQMSHSALIAISSLKVNPHFSTNTDIEKFWDIMTPDTVNCNFQSVTKEVLKRAIYVRNYPITDDFLTSENMKLAEKFTNLCFTNTFGTQSIYTEENQQDTFDSIKLFFELLTQNPTRKVTIPFELFWLFVDECNTSNSPLLPNFERCYFPKNVFLYFIELNGVRIPERFILSQEKFQLVNAAVTKFQCQIAIDWSVLIDSDYALLTPHCKNYSAVMNNNSNLVVPYLKENEISFFFTFPRNQMNSSCQKVTHIDFTKIEEKIVLCYAPHVKFLIQHFEINLIAFKIPRCVEEITVDDSERCNTQTCTCHIPENLSIRKLNVSRCGVFYNGNIKNVERVSLNNFSSLKKDRNNEISQIKYWKKSSEFPFINVRELELKNIQNIKIGALDNLEVLKIDKCDNVSCYVNEKCAKYFSVENTSNSTFYIDANKSDVLEFKNCKALTLVIFNTKLSHTNLALFVCDLVKVDIENKECQSLCVINSNDLQITRNCTFKTLKIVNSTIGEYSNLFAEEIDLSIIQMYQPIDFSKAKKVTLCGLKSFSFNNNLFDNCEELKVVHSSHCQFFFENSHLKILTLDTS